jgi:hypothetical protein
MKKKKKLYFNPIDIEVVNPWIKSIQYVKSLSKYISTSLSYYQEVSSTHNHEANEYDDDERSRSSTNLKPRFTRSREAIVAVRSSTFDTFSSACLTIRWIGSLAII